MTNIVKVRAPHPRPQPRQHKLNTHRPAVDAPFMSKTRRERSPATVARTDACRAFQHTSYTLLLWSASVRMERGTPCFHTCDGLATTPTTVQSSKHSHHDAAQTHLGGIVPRASHE